MDLPENIVHLLESNSNPVLIAGPTASGKSALALQIAQRYGGRIINADALQVFSNWCLLTARPDRADLACAPHALYGHVPGNTPYSVGSWLRELAPLLRLKERPIIVGGTGLYFSALTQGLAPIPPISDDIRRQAQARLRDQGLAQLAAQLDPQTRARIDLNNPMRVLRAWEVLAQTGRPLAHWQEETAPPLLPLRNSLALRIEAPKAWLTPRIEHRFDLMLAGGAIDEARANLSDWNPSAPSAKAIGAPELIAYLRGEITLEDAKNRAIINSRQYAKRQRSWLRQRMPDWHQIDAPKIV